MRDKAPVYYYGKKGDGTNSAQGLGTWRVLKSVSAYDHKAENNVTGHCNVILSEFNFKVA